MKAESVAIIDERERRTARSGLALSATLHCALLAALVFAFRYPLRSDLIAAGEGEGSGGVIEVGVADARELGLAPPRAVSYIGEEESATNQVEVETKRPAPEDDAELLPSTARRAEPKPSPKAATDRPVAPRQEQIFTRRSEQGRSSQTSVEVGRSYGSPTPALTGGVGIGRGGGAGAGTGGVPGGSEYGRRIQMILSRHYNPPAIAQATSLHYVIIQVRIARDGRITSIVSGRVAPGSIRQASQFDLVTRAAERAVLASNPLPPFPAGFLAGVGEGVAEIWFRYPK
jgi:hypothetical protein